MREELTNSMANKERVIIDMHVHTKYSDGVHDIKEILLYAKHKGLSGIAITDHNTVLGALKALKLSMDYNVIIIPGVEVNTSKAHVLLYGIREEIPIRLKKNPSIQELIDYAQENDLFISIAHPYGRALFFKYPVVNMHDILHRVHAIEIANGRTPPRQNAEAFKLAMKYNKAFTGGSDAHIIDELGRIRVIAFEPVENYEDFLKQVLKRKIKIVGSTKVITIISGIIKRRIVLLEKSIRTLIK